MSTRVIRKTKDPLELLERALSKTSLTTKHVSHRHILDVGGDVLMKSHVDVDGQREQAINEAVEAAERRHTRELRAALGRLEKHLLAEKHKALESQKKYYEDKARRVEEQRDQAEQERFKEMQRYFEKEKEEALRIQWEEAERLKQAAISEACTALRIQLRNEFAWEKERAIAEALAFARKQFKIREQEIIAQTRQECEQAAAKEAARVAAKHAEELARQQEKYRTLERKYTIELDHRKRVEEDFRELQRDYQRFMDYTDGKYNSDYMMVLRHQGLKKSKKKVSVVTYEDVEKLYGQ